jgi:hypothetical protein
MVATVHQHEEALRAVLNKGRPRKNAARRKQNERPPREGPQPGTAVKNLPTNSEVKNDIAGLQKNAA